METGALVQRHGCSADLQGRKNDRVRAWHTSYGHAKYEKRGAEFGPDADYSPYIAPGIIALDACTVLSGKINVIVLED